MGANGYITAWEGGNLEVLVFSWEEKMIVGVGGVRVWESG